MKTYPIGIQDFRKIIAGGYQYVDKTRLIHQLLTTGDYYFLSRPRRFGKSLLLSTIKEIYSGSRELFEGLWIADQWDWTVTRPVVHLRFAKSDYQELGLRQAIIQELDKSAAALGIVLTQLNLKGRFEELLTLTAASLGKVVLLIDEYDKPIIDYLEQPERALENRAIMKQFYSVLKDADPQLEFVLITGVSKFSKVSIFSDLNNLNDLTLHPGYTTLLGITAEELEDNFGPALDVLAQKQPAVRADVRRYYNGYSWGGETKVYNPFSILRFLESGSLQNYWFETGTPTFLIDLMRTEGRFVWDSDEFVSLIAINNFDIEHLSLVATLFQTGYLTLAEKNEAEGWCRLTYPNREVQMSLEQLLLGAYQGSRDSGLPTVLQLRQALERDDLPKVMTVINAAFASIPYDLWRNATELHYHALVHLTFSLLGNYLRSEVHSAQGRCDAVVETATHVYAFEFKLDESPEVALQQIIDRDYLGPYRADARQRVAVGVNFLSAERKGSFMERRDF